MNIEIGGGTLTAPGWINLDADSGDGEWKRDAQDVPWPSGDQTADIVRASHVLEHIPAGRDRIAVFNEVHRVLRPGGVFEVKLPLIITESGAISWHSIADPTHVSFWCRESFHYFTCSTDGRRVFAANTPGDYGIKRWLEMHWSINDGFEGYWIGTPYYGETR